MRKSFQDGMLDVTECDDLEITLSQLHPAAEPVLHVNTKEGCILRICLIRGEITVNDLTDRKKIINWAGLNLRSDHTVAIHGDINERAKKRSLVRKE